MFLANPYSGTKLSIQEKFEKEAKIDNWISYAYWYTRLVEIAIAGFEWKNLPPELDPRFLEMILCFDGKALFYYDDDLGQYVTLQFFNASTLDIYREPFRRTAYSPAVNFRYKALTEKESVIIWNNSLRYPEIIPLRMYAKRLAELERSIDVNVKGQKTPKIIRCTQEERLTLENLFKKYEGNIPFIFGSKNLANLEDITVLDTTSPYVADKLQILKRQIFAEALTYFGIENANTEKKERLVSDEVASNFGGVEIARRTRLQARKLAAQKINRMFGLDIDVEFAAGTPEERFVEAEKMIETEGGIENE
jgi:hypothetical protein